MSKMKKLSKVEQDKEIKALKDRKERDGALGYRYSPCSYCGKSVRWRLPTGVEPTPENIKIYEPKHCGEDECSKKYFIEHKPGA
jgi:hypothetical protein